MFVYQLMKWTSKDSSSEDEQNIREEETEIDEKIRSQFVSACTYLPTIPNAERISKADRLYLYARYKQATSGKAGNLPIISCSLKPFERTLNVDRMKAYKPITAFKCAKADTSICLE